MEITLKSIRTIFSRSATRNQSESTTESSSGETTIQTNSHSSSQGTAQLINGTPFTLVGNDKQGYFIGYGHAQITQHYPTKKQALKTLKTHQWEITCNMMAYTVEHWQKLKAAALKEED